ncbi:MAG: DUF502 domain-containing protein [Gemmatimonadales bacterium]
MRQLANYFLRGLLISAPLALTLYVCWLTIHWFDALLGTTIPGLGVVTAVLVITAIGALGSNLVTRGAVAVIDRAIEKLPFVRLVYSSTKDLLNAFVGEQRRFNRPVSARIGEGDAEIQLLGFVTADSLESLGLSDRVAVYVPFSYSVAGHVLVMSADRVTPLETDAADAMAFIVSGGVTRTATEAKPDPGLSSGHEGSRRPPPR